MIFLTIPGIFWSPPTYILQYISLTKLFNSLMYLIDFMFYK